jgi:hypothetical protein
MENDDKDEKKSHKKVKQTIGQVILATRKAKKAVAPPKRNRVPFYNNSTRPSSGPAGNIQKTNNTKQKNEGVVVNDRNNLGFARAGFLTPTKTATDANKAARGNFAGRTNKTNEPEKRMAVAAIDNSSRKRGKKEIGAQKMDGAPTELVPVHGINTRRLLLEDFVVLQPGTTVWILVRKDHVTFSEFSQLPHESTVQFNLADPKTAMQSYKAVVLQNPQFGPLSCGMRNREDIMDLITCKGGGAIAFGFTSSTDASGIELKFAEFLENPLTMHVWAAIPNHRNYAEMLKPKMRNNDALTQLYNRLCRESYGDKCALALLQHAHRAIVASQKSKAKKDEDPTTKCQSCGSMTATAVPNPNEFCKFMDALVMDRIDGCYGQFCNIHSPIVWSRIRC